MTDAALLADLERVELEIETRWDEAKGERRRFLLSACEAVALARRLVAAEPGDPDPRTVEPDSRPRRKI